jgi:hypothetical protein
MGIKTRTTLTCDECGEQYFDDNDDYGLPPATEDHLITAAELDGWSVNVENGHVHCEDCALEHGF